MTEETKDRWLDDNNGGSNSAQPNAVQEYHRRLSTMEGEKAEIADEIRELKAEAKDHGLNVRALTASVKRSRESADTKEKREEYEDVLETYLVTLKLVG